MNKILTSLALAALLASSTGAMAQTVDPTDPGHPRVNEVDQRLENQQQRIDKGVQDGTITAKQAAHDEARDAHVEKEMTRDEAKHNGHITKREDLKMNRQLDKNSRHIHHQRHGKNAAAQ